MSLDISILLVRIFLSLPPLGRPLPHIRTHTYIHTHTHRGMILLSVFYISSFSPPLFHPYHQDSFGDQLWFVILKLLRQDKFDDTEGTESMGGDGESAGSEEVITPRGSVGFASQSTAVSYSPATPVSTPASSTPILIGAASGAQSSVQLGQGGAAAPAAGGAGAGPSSAEKSAGLMVAAKRESGSFSSPSVVVTPSSSRSSTNVPPPSSSAQPSRPPPSLPSASNLRQASAEAEGASGTFSGAEVREYINTHTHTYIYVEISMLT